MVEKECVNIPQSTTGTPSSSMTGTPSSNITIGDYQDGSFCWHRLPCGICKLTGMQCPKAGPYEVPGYPYSPITWTSTGVSVNPTVSVQPDRCTGQQFTNEQMSQMTTATGKYDPNLKAMN